MTISAFEAAQARCRFSLATDGVLNMLQIKRAFSNTTPFFIYESAPLPLDEPWHLPHTGNAPNDADVLAAQAEGARMAMGDQAPSAPADLDEPIDGFWRRVREDDLAAARGILGWSLALLSVVATASAVAWALR